MQCLGTDTSSVGPWWGREEQTESVNVPPITGTRVSYNSGIYNSGISISEDNPVSCVQAGGNGNMSFALAG